MNSLEDYDDGFPVEAVFYDVKDQEVKEIEIPEKVWNNTLKTFENNDNVNPNVVFKYMSKQKDSKTKKIFT
jgi:hypothetical protein